jgi:UDPglucose 6-dehydrogenase/UDP-N-acetyl-D-mannosaminuronic acid dehydrogenase
MSPAIVLTARKLNEAQPEAAIAALKQATSHISCFPDIPVVTVLGLAFKGAPETDDLRGTMARPILSALQRHFPNARFRAFDPVVTAQAIRDFGLDPVASLEEALAGANLAVITNNHSRFRSMPIETLSHRMASPAMFYDFWNNFNADYLLLAPHAGYMALGSHGRAKLPKVQPL